MNLYHCQAQLLSGTSGTVYKINRLRAAETFAEAGGKMLEIVNGDCNGPCIELHIWIVSNNPTQEEIEKFS